MITIGFSSRKVDPEFVKCLKKSCGIPNVEILPFENTGTHSLTDVYNGLLEKATNDIVVLCHDDIYFDTNNWARKIVKHFKKNPEYGILGVAGSVKLGKSAAWFEDKSKMKGIVNHEINGTKSEAKFSDSLGKKIDPAVVVDGLFIAIQKSRIKCYFNEEVKGFHFYDVDFCARNFLKNVPVGIIYNVRITHKSGGQFDKKWEAARAEFSNRCANNLPIKLLREWDVNSKLKVMLSCLFFKDYTGSEIYVYELAKNLIRLNCEVTVVSDINGVLARQAATFGIKVISRTEYPGFKLGDGRWRVDTPNGKQLTQPNKLYKVGNVDFDIIHVQHKPVTEQIIQVYPELPKIATIHSEVISLEDPVRDISILKYIAIRPAIKKKMIEQNGIPEEKIEVIYNPVDGTRFNLKGCENRGYILFVGTLDYLRENAIRDIAQHAKSVGKELWLVGKNTSNYLDELLEAGHVKHFLPTNQVERLVKNCAETAGILLGRTTIEGWMCGKPAWIYQVDNSGVIQDKELVEPPENLGVFNAFEVAKLVKRQYINVLKEWHEETEDKIQEAKNDAKIAPSDLIFNGCQLKPNNTKNWGDLITHRIVKELSGSAKIKDTDVFNVKSPQKKYPIYSTGSIMHFTKKNCIVWGTGCIDKNMVGEEPAKIYAVRGPLTRQELIKKGFECPEVYGDPALLYPKLYNPSIEKKYKYGIIPHYIEYASKKDISVIKNLEALGFKVIDICAGANEFIAQLLEVENILSSSLHGLIVADAYGLPNARVNISNKLMGGHFKFEDYCLSVGREADYGFQLTVATKLEELEALKYNTKINLDIEKLANSAPWHFDENKHLFY